MTRAQRFLQLRTSIGPEDQTAKTELRKTKRAVSTRDVLGMPLPMGDRLPCSSEPRLAAAPTFVVGASLCPRRPIAKKHMGYASATSTLGKVYLITCKVMGSSKSTGRASERLDTSVLRATSDLLHHCLQRPLLTRIWALERTPMAIHQRQQTTSSHYPRVRTKGVPETYTLGAFHCREPVQQLYLQNFRSRR